MSVTNRLGRAMSPAVATEAPSIIVDPCVFDDEPDPPLRVRTSAETGHLRIVIDHDPHCSTIVATGQLDPTTVPAASAFISREIAASPSRDWFFDLGGVDFVDWTGVQLLAIVHRALKPTGSMTLVNPPSSLRHLLSLTAANSHFPQAVSEPPRPAGQLPAPIGSDGVWMPGRQVGAGQLEERGPTSERPT